MNENCQVYEGDFVLLTMFSMMNESASGSFFVWKGFVSEWFCFETKIDPIFSRPSERDLPKFDRFWFNIRHKTFLARRRRFF